MDKIKVGILGSSGSIGRQTLDIIENHSDKFVVSLLSNFQNELIVSQAQKFHPKIIVSKNTNISSESCKVYNDLTVLNQPGVYCDCDIVVNGISGINGLLPSIAILDAGKNLAIANKEAIVCGYEFLKKAAQKSGAKIIPVDSEHSAIFQILEDDSNIESIILTASGGAFRDFSKIKLETATAKMALNHPTWNMGTKVTIDSATLANKGLEILEAKYLFNTTAVDVVVHRQSIVHGLIEFKDNTVKAVLSAPDMTIPIQYALTYPNRWQTKSQKLNLSQIGSLNFEKPDFERFPCLKIAMDILKSNNRTSAIYALSDETAVECYIKEKIMFFDIPMLINMALSRFNRDIINDIGEIFELQQEINSYIFSIINGGSLNGSFIN